MVGELEIKNKSTGNIGIGMYWDGGLVGDGMGRGLGFAVVYGWFMVGLW